MLLDVRADLQQRVSGRWKTGLSVASSCRPLERHGGIQGFGNLAGFGEIATGEIKVDAAQAEPGNQAGENFAEEAGASRRRSKIRMWDYTWIPRKHFLPPASHGDGQEGIQTNPVVSI